MRGERIGIRLRRGRIVSVGAARPGAVELEVVPTQAAAFALYRGRAFRDVHRQRMTWDLS